jgi:TonB family protein
MRVSRILLPVALLAATGQLQGQLETRRSPALDSISDGPVSTPYTVAPEIENVEEVIEAMKRVYPPVLRDAGIGGRISVWFLIDELGQVVDARIAQPSGRRELDAAALEVALVFSFTPARMYDEVVPVWIEFPISFEVRIPVSGH